MNLRAWNVAVLVAVAGLWLASDTQKEKAVLSHAKSEAVRTLEAEAAARPNDASVVRQLAQAYLDARASGHAVAVIEASPGPVKADPRVEHVYARALVDQGRNQDALAAELRVLDRCVGSTRTPTMAPGCDSWLIASATRRADILQALVNLGVEDSMAEPEASSVAYHTATRHARVVVQ
jgi:hypothetical protein